MKHPRPFELGVVFALAALAALVLSMLYPRDRSSYVPMQAPPESCRQAYHGDTHTQYFIHCTRRGA